MTHIISFGQLSGPLFATCHITVYTPWVATGNLLKPKSDLATLLSTLQGLPILVGEKNPLTSGPLVFLHSLAWGTWAFGSATPVRLLCRAFALLSANCSSSRHSMAFTMPLLRCHLLKEVFLIIWKAHSATCYPNILLNFSLDLTLTCTCLFVCLFFCLPSVFLHRHTAPWELNFVPYFFST